MTIGRGVWFVVIAGASSLGCPLLSKGVPDASVIADSDAAPPPPVPTVRPDPTLDAANKIKVARYGDETKMDPVDAKLVQGVAARSFPPNGDFIALLRSGTDVTKVAIHEDYVLIAFANPKNASEKLIGWINPAGFKELAAGAPSTGACRTDKECKTGQRCILTGPARNIARCATACAAAPPVCATGQECAGEGTVDGSFFAFCTSTQKKATSTDSFKVGDRVTVEWHGGWYPASVIGVPSATRYRIHYDGYDASWDENVDPSRIRKR